MIDFEIAKRSGLRQKGELDKLFRVSYPMVNAYLSGKSYPRGVNRVRIATVLDVLGKLCDSGKLPLAEGADQANRETAVTKIESCVASVTSVA